MNQTAKVLDELSILEIIVDENFITARISDGRSVSVPIAWFPLLVDANSNQLSNYEISPSGYGVHWPDLDEDVSIKTFINL